ncbi:MAG: cytochrome c biogenesis CcdA family protein, partial [Methanosarcinales archaeon]
MISFLADLSTSFILGLLTPLTAVCVLPLYPGFLAYLSNQVSGSESDKKHIILFGIIITFGVILFLVLMGLIFTTFLEVSLNKVIRIVSPFAFIILMVISILLIVDYDIGRFFPRAQIPTVKKPLLSAFIYGFFFGAIVVPCNPLFIAALFTKTLSSMDFFLNILNFLVFGIGIGFPLLVFSAISTTKSMTIINFLTKNKRNINLSAGILMLIMSLY